MAADGYPIPSVSVRVLIAQHNAHIKAEHFAASVSLSFSLAERDVAALSAALRNLSQGKIVPRRL
ncbi:MAG: hypothetical protein CUN49_10105 [Candidatus Thermofonsia Clade 1 bacterium]|jgi:putative IMPACT (imprinted ancient) family translation regulator|uniref:UPF0029 domain-containing protein n=1 Tax=Candidatus Thermofonsia Clade 1 bacterium TaxID=2364210 RepID=A0A2M8PDB3_9CHLR|nr:MAG: hypothetical protein CUN49_10105 [Candidatus Thermofonsia Clade 1 bacterium]